VVEAMSGDALSDVLRNVRLNGAVFFDVQATAPWVVEAPAACDVAPFIMPRSDHVIEYHLVVSGQCYAGLVGEAPAALSAGDLVIFPQGDSHVVSSEPGMRGQPNIGLHRDAAGGNLPLMLQQGGGGERCALICGFIGCDRHPYNPLLSTLPRTLVVRREQVARATHEGRSTTSTLAVLAELALSESKARRSGSECALSRLSELLFVEAIRAHVETLPAEQRDWLGALRDPHIGKALAALHDRPADAWNLDDLARVAGLSRSILAERFTYFVGMPPIQYLTQWRMQLAAERLRATNAGLSEIATAVGYGSESAFSRAFKRHVGVAPATFRQTPGHQPGSSNGPLIG
jgi:AraC-like DNA-binding protein